MMGSCDTSPGGGLVGVLLAAGRSRRMGQNKLLLPWPAGHSAEASSKTVIAASFDAIADHCRDMIVVVGSDAGAAVHSLQPRAFILALAQPDAQMFDSLKAGLVCALKLPDVAAVFLHLGDHPQVNRTTIEDILARFRHRPEVAVMPEYKGRGGHPVVIPMALCSAILESSQPGGLREFWRQRPDLCLRAPVDDPGVTADLDSPEDYQTRRIESSG